MFAGDNARSRIIYVAPTQDQAKRIFWRGLIKMIPYDWIYSRLDTAPQTLILRNQSIITVHGSGNFDALRGEGFDFSIIDEPAQQNEELWYEVIRPGLSDKQGKALIIGTPKGRANWFYDIMMSPDWSSHIYTTLEGGWVSAEEIETAQRQLDPRTFRQEFEASFEEFGGLAYYTFTDKNIKAMAFDNSAETYLCWDFNASIKPMTCIIVQKHDNIYYGVKEFVLTYSNTIETCEAVNEYLKSVEFIGNLNITGDYAGKRRESSASFTDYEHIEHFFKNYNGYSVKTRPTLAVKDRVSALCSMFSSYSGAIRFYFDPANCPETILDFQRVEFKDDGRHLDDKNPKRTHQSDAVSYLAYNYHPLEREVKISGF